MQAEHREEAKEGLERDVLENREALGLVPAGQEEEGGEEGQEEEEAVPPQVLKERIESVIEVLGEFQVRRRFLMPAPAVCFALFSLCPSRRAGCACQAGKMFFGGCAFAGDAGDAELSIRITAEAIHTRLAKVKRIREEFRRWGGHCCGGGFFFFKSCFRHGLSEGRYKHVVHRFVYRLQPQEAHTKSTSYVLCKKCRCFTPS